eukprot:gnl/TRDRNA2_/TRDRNA2_170425_c1_seq12.p2 gnl/TRDRNA2_/TRDRNA2_170425_c1~~gnl/TRDRNA2_/TRDRNA2_170425_c1_seq12.p2  ORF type:complete len:134 (+),score=23.09 gnl/TRDRNA2_/TRDRNA2_170425_c1_seq12:119-520(+)
MAWTAADWSTTPVSGKAKMAQDILGQDRLQQLLIDADRDAARCVELQRKQNAGSSRSAADGAEQASVLSVQEQAELRRLRRCRSCTSLDPLETCMSWLLRGSGAAMSWAAGSTATDDSCSGDTLQRHRWTHCA